MAVHTLTDDLLSIARASLPGEMPERLRKILVDPTLPREDVAERARYVVGLLRLQAKGLERWPPGRLTAAEVSRAGLEKELAERLELAEGLKRDAQLLEDALIDEGVLEKPTDAPKTMRGIWKGAQITDADIEAAKVRFGRASDDVSN